MSDQPATEDAGGTMFDDPNREAVGLEPAWVEGTGGQPGTEAAATGEQPDDLESMTKAELLDYAKGLGVTPANNDMTKAELIDAIEAEQG
jgi:hypothetical protein